MVKNSNKCLILCSLPITRSYKICVWFFRTEKTR